MIREHFQFRETIATILGDKQPHIEAAKEGMLAARQELERHITVDPFFAATFEPYLPASEARTVTRMARAGYAAGVGPMAAVAGTIAWAGVEAMQEAGAAFGIVDNGGDIALMADRPVRVGIYAGDSPLSSRFAFVVPPPNGILGICTSSATVGPSVSFGVADAVIVFSPDVAAADAWATGLCNRIGADDDQAFAALPGSAVTGVLAILGEQVMRWGSLPEIIQADVSDRLITSGRGIL